MENTELRELWRNGFVMINKIRHINKLGKYISKYIGKDLFDYRYFGMRKILRSMNLQKPVTAVFKKDVSEHLEKENNKYEVLLKNSYNSDYQGEVDYMLCKLTK